jgi:hypothetical protein
MAIAAQSKSPAPGTSFTRIKEILDNSLVKWKQEHGREAKMKGAHMGELSWTTKDDLLNSAPYGLPLISEDKVGNGRGTETNLVKILRSHIGGYRRMPSGGPYIPPEEISEIIEWIDEGMPD